MMRKDPTTEYICYPCSVSLDEAFDFKKKCTKSMSAYRSTQKPNFKCGECFMKFLSLKDLDVHSVSHSIEISDDDDSDDSSSASRTTKKNSTKGFKIPPDSSVARNHAVSDYVCIICNQRFGARSGLTVHLQWHQKKKVQFKCEYCDNIYLRKKQMNAHIRNKHARELSA